MENSRLFSLHDAANSLEISVALVDKFIRMGLVTPVEEGRAPKLTAYGMRRLTRIVEMYEKSFSADRIEKALNH